MGELWRDLVEVLRRRPTLWLPVLVADLLSYLVNLLRTGLLRALVLHETAQRSALTGTVVHTPMSASTMQSAAMAALLISWFTYLIRILLYCGAFVVTAALIDGYLQRSREAKDSIAAKLARSRGGILELALRSLAVYAVAALLVSSLTPFLSRHGHAAIVRSPWLGYALSVLVLLALSTVLPPVALRLLAGKHPDRSLARQSQRFTFGLALVASVLALIVGANGAALSGVPVAARYPLEIIGSLIVALPYVLIFTGLTLLSKRIAVPDESLETA